MTERDRRRIVGQRHRLAFQCQIKDLIEGELRTGQSSPVGEVSAADKQKFKGDGTYTRNDRFTAKITATGCSPILSPTSLGTST